MKTTQKIPKLRFPGLSDEWEVKKLGDIADVRDGTHESPKYVEIGKPLITSKNLLKNGSLDFKNVSYISGKDFEEINRRSGVHVGDILFGMIGTIGHPVRVKSSDFAIKNVALIKQSGLLDNSYLIQYLASPSIEKQFFQKNAGGTQKFIALGIIRDLAISNPSQEEQRKIAGFLGVMDDRIYALQKKVELLQKYKKGIMQKIFSQEIRFKNENGKDYPAWQEKKLGDFTTIKTGNLNVEDALPDGEYTFFDRSQEIKRYNEYSYDNEALIYAGEGAEFLPRYFKGKYGLHQRAYTIFGAQGVSMKFLYYFMLTQNNHFLRMAVGTTAKSLRMDCFTKCVIPIPTSKEQQKIADFLTSIDDKIDLTEKRELVQAIKFKQALLQQMFV